MSWQRPLLWVLLCAPLCALAQSPAGRNPVMLSAVERTHLWLKGFRRTPREHHGLHELGRILRHLERSAQSGDLTTEQAGQALTQICAAGWGLRGGPWAPLGDRVIQKARRSLGKLGSEELVEALATRSLVAGSEGLEMRIATSLLLAGERSPHVVSALLMNLRVQEPELRSASLEALAGRSNDLIHTAFIARLERAEDQEAAWIEGHFAKVQLAPKSRACEPLARAATDRILGSDWRTAVGGLRLAKALPDERAVPLLIQALELWNQRVARGGPYRRVQNDVLAALETRSGRTIGLKPQRWRTWWSAVCDGHTHTASQKKVAERTQVGFFGLDAVSDRILFVIDRSQSMSQSMGGAERRPQSRYQVATDQMLQFLEGLGSETHFGIVLFSDSVRAWHPEMVQARKGNLQRARSWLRSQQPNGGTLLRKGVERALGVDSKGRLDLDDLEVDTVIVLCDGATGEGPGWVGPFLQGAGLRSRVKFHGIQIGGGGDGTLEALAAGTGGDYLVVDRL